MWIMTEIQEIVQKLTKKHGNNRENLIPVLQGIVEKNNFISDTAMVEVAKAFDISSAEVYGTASFYSFLDVEERGAYVVRVCKSITCDLKGKNKILQSLENELKIKLGETSQNKKFSLLETNCIGLCDQGPAMLINGEPYAELTPEKIHEIISSYRNERKIN